MRGVYSWTMRWRGREVDASALRPATHLRKSERPDGISNRWCRSTGSTWFVLLVAYYHTGRVEVETSVVFHPLTAASNRRLLLMAVAHSDVSIIEYSFRLICNSEGISSNTVGYLQ